MSDRPLRVQLRRAKGWRMPPNTTKVDRTTRYGNPWRAMPPSRHTNWWLIAGPRSLPRPERYPNEAAALHRAADLFRMATQDRTMWHLLDFAPTDIAHLRGRNLACWCRLCPAHADGKTLGASCAACEPCHADWLLGLANSPLRCIGAT